MTSPFVSVDPDLEPTHEVRIRVGDELFGYKLHENVEYAGERGAEAHLIVLMHMLNKMSEGLYERGVISEPFYVMEERKRWNS